MKYQAVDLTSLYPVTCHSKWRSSHIALIKLFQPLVRKWDSCRRSATYTKIIPCGTEYRYVMHSYKKVKDSRNRPGVVQRVPGGLGSQISRSFGTWRWWGCQTHAPVAFTSRKCSGYSFLLGAESTPWPWYGRKEYVTEKSSDNTGNRSRHRPTSSVVP